jgi:hypothetical protein
VAPAVGRVGRFRRGTAWQVLSTRHRLPERSLTLPAATFTWQSWTLRGVGIISVGRRRSQSVLTGLETAMERSRIVAERSGIATERLDMATDRRSLFHHGREAWAPSCHARCGRIDYSGLKWGRGFWSRSEGGSVRFCVGAASFGVGLRLSSPSAATEPDCEHGINVA